MNSILKNKKNFIIDKNYVSIFSIDEEKLEIAKEILKEIVSYRDANLLIKDFVQEILENENITKEKAKEIFKKIDSCVFTYIIAAELEKKELLIKYPIMILSLNNSPQIDKVFYQLNKCKTSIEKLEYARYVKELSLIKIKELNSINKLNEIKKTFGIKLNNLFEELDGVKNIIKFPQQILFKDNKTINDFSEAGILNIDKFNKSELKEKIINLMIGKNSTINNKVIKEINISFPANIVFDCNKLEECFYEKGLLSYIELLNIIEKENKPLDLNKNANLYNLLFMARNLLGSNVLPISIGMITKNQPYDAKIFYQSQYAHNLKFDYSAYTGGENRSLTNLEYKVDLAFCSNENSKFSNEIIGVNAVNVNKENNRLSKIYETKKISDLLLFIKDNLINEELKALINNSLNYLEKNNLMDYKIYYNVKENPINNYLKSKNFIENNISKDINYLFDAKDLLINQKETQILIMLKRKIDIKEALCNSDFKINIHVLANKLEIENLKMFLPTNIIKNINFNYNDFEKVIEDNNIDLFITGNFNNVKYSINKGYASIKVNPKIILDEHKLILEEKSINFIFDLDEVITQGDEFFYQEYHLSRFIQKQVDDLNIPLSKSILFEYFYKIGEISKHFNKNPSSKIDINVEVLTARGGDESSLRFFNLLTTNGLYVDKVFFLNGRDKSTHIENCYKKGGLTQFIDDHPLHINRLQNSMKLNNFTVIDGHFLFGVNNINDINNNNKPKV